MIIITIVAKIPPIVDMAFATGPINFKPPRTINNGMKINSERAINQEETIGIDEKKSIFKI
tara:strand:- start:1744 stop:1926 length:183 start_codon:yes stop_codon:yes gene_type:complete